MKKFIIIIISTILILLLIIFLYGNLVLRPRNSRAQCDQEARDYVTQQYKDKKGYSFVEREADYDLLYKSCLHKHGY